MGAVRALFRYPQCSSAKLDRWNVKTYLSEYQPNPAWLYQGPVSSLVAVLFLKACADMHSVPNFLNRGRAALPIP